MRGGCGRGCGLPHPVVPLDPSSASGSKRIGASKKGNPGVIRLLVLVGLILGASPAFGQDGLPAEFYGDWQGKEVTASEGSDAVEVTAEDLSVRIEADETGFRMHWTALEREKVGGPLVRRPIEARFVPTDRPGVFAFEPEDSSMLLSLFGDPATNNPLEGEPLLWARFDGKALSIYGLVINPEGGFDLYQHVRRLTGDGMTVRQIHRTEDKAVILDGRLVRVGD
jgi:hypothetical protein